MRAAELADLGDPRTIPAIEGVVYSDAEPEDLRSRLLARLATHDRGRFAATFNERVVEVDHWPVLRAALAEAVTIGSETIPGIVRSWARPSALVADPLRPERAALEAVTQGRPAEEVLFEVFTGLDRGSGLSLREQVAAWTVLSRLHPPETLRDLLASAAETTPLSADLRAAAEVLDVLPRDHEAVLWLVSLRERESGAWWRDTAQRATRLTPEQRRGLELRHLPALRLVGNDLLQSSRDSLAAAIASRLHGRTHATRTDHGAEGGAANESFAHHADALVWSDLLAIHLVLDGMDDRSLVSQWFTQADDDHADTGSEHGGVLRWEGGRWTADSHKPLLRAHDNAFYSGPDLIAALYGSLAHYHFHAQRHKGRDFAGPGGGDLRFADRMRATCLVLTFVDSGTMNVDYYAAGRVVIDLGIVRHGQDR